MRSIDWKELAKQIEGDVELSAGARGVYATDASVYQAMPRAIVLPRQADDLPKILAFCQTNEIPIVARGGGTSLSGQAIGPGIIVDFSRYLNRIARFDPVQKTATVEPGVVLDELNQQLADTGLHFAPDPATASRATIGGMIGNNSCGTRSIVYGRTSDSVETLAGWLADGSPFESRRLNPSEWTQAAQGQGRLAQVYSGIDQILRAQGEAIATRIPELPRMVAGYALRSLMDPSRPRSLSDLICGSEGTLALVHQATLRLTPRPAATCLVLSAFESLDAALVSLPAILAAGPSAVELLDEVLIGEAVRNPSTRDLAQVIVPTAGIPVAAQLVEFFGASQAEASERARAYVTSMNRMGAASSHKFLDDLREQQQAWEVRRLGLGLISNLPGRAKAIALIEDACLPIANLPEYNRFVYSLGRQLGLGISTYAHASVGVLHYKVMLDLHREDDRRKMRVMAEACFEKCCELGGVFSGEHGDGIVRGEFLPRQFGPQVYQAFVAIKQLFDPQGILNPGRKIDSPPLDGPLRYGQDPQERARYRQETDKATSHFRYADQGGLIGAIEQCNGVGACRQTLKGTMCPSYRATRDEQHSTRGRANLLRLAISGQLQPAGLANPELHQALELCLACKACKSECPNAVDMARLKSEALQARWDQSGVSRQARMLGQLPQRIEWLSRHRWMAGALRRLSPLRAMIQAFYGLDRRRRIPLPKRDTFDEWWNVQPPAEAAYSGSRTVALMVDTWNRFLEPEIGIAAARLLSSCGYRVEWIETGDALRTRLSAGLIREARQMAEPLFRDLARYATRGCPIICLEPSEASALAEDLPDLLPANEQVDAVAKSTRLIDDFLADAVRQGTVRLSKINPQDSRTVIVHPHCHQRALFRPQATVELLTAAGYSTQLSDLGCCGMAGAFGYTHFDVSQQIANLKFLPAIRATGPNQIMIATGTSCRQQALDLARIRLPHWLELLRGEGPNRVSTK